MKYARCFPLAVLAAMTMAVTSDLVAIPPPGLNATEWAMLQQRVSQEAYLKAPVSIVSGYFGWSVAVSGDTVVIGSPFGFGDPLWVAWNPTVWSPYRTGAAFVFVREGTNWIQQAYLKASNAGSNDWFGVSVAISGDTIVIGAESEASS